MNKKALFYGLAYSLVFIGLKLYILLGGYALTKFGYYYSGITGVFLIIPFYILAIKDVRDNNYGGVISGREAIRITLTIFAVSAVITSVYNYFEFTMSGKDLAIQYYNSEQFLDYLKLRKVKAEEFSRIISEQVKNAETSAFKTTTGKLFSFMITGLSGAFVTSVIMKKSAK